MLCKIKKMFSKVFDENNYIAELNSRIEELETEIRQLKFQLEENELEYKDSLLRCESKIETLTKNNLNLEKDNSEITFKLNQISTICCDKKD